ncbi:MAG: hypothetical protein U5K70_02895 [Halodesulfurarchaeum sp.]|nr:hypothetical protein [Halodesulfurarchaeum sp.]
MSRSLPARLGVFVLVAVLVIAAAGIGGYAMADTPPDRVDATVEKDYFTDQEIVENAQLTPRSGKIELEDQPSRTVLVSTDGSVSDLEPVIDALVTHGHEVRIHGGGTSVTAVSGILTGSVTASSSVSASEGGLQSELAEVDALFAVGGSQFQAEDYGIIENFSEEGSVVLATGPAGPFSGGTNDELTSRFGVTIGSGYLYNMAENDANYQRVFAGSGNSPVADGVSETVLDTAAPVRSHNATSVLSVGEETRYSVTRAAGSHDVAVRTGNVLVVGDTDFMAPLDFNRADNEAFIGNVLTFLTDTPENPYTPPTDGEQGPTDPSERYPTAGGSSSAAEA